MAKSEKSFPKWEIVYDVLHFKKGEVYPVRPNEVSHSGGDPVAYRHSKYTIEYGRDEAEAKRVAEFRLAGTYGLVAGSVNVVKCLSKEV